MDLLENVLIGVLSGTVASAIWFIGLQRLRPRLDISTDIAEEPVAIAGSPRYYIKIVNKSHRTTSDLRFELCVLFRTASMSANRKQVIDHTEPEPLMIRGKRRGSTSNGYRVGYITGPKEALAEIRTNYSDLESYHIRMQVYARDQISGVGELFEQRYNCICCSIKVGQFQSGPSLEVSQVSLT